MAWSVTAFGWLIILACCLLLGWTVTASVWLWRVQRPRGGFAKGGGMRKDEVPAVLLPGDLERRIREAFEKGHCPDCNHQGFVTGPSGGMSQNIMCANPKCCSAFNVAEAMGEVFYADRISNAYWNPPIKKDREGKVLL